jgi:hypothetical protein
MKMFKLQTQRQLKQMSLVRAAPGTSAAATQRQHRQMSPKKYIPIQPFFGCALLFCYPFGYISLFIFSGQIIPHNIDELAFCMRLHKIQDMLTDTVSLGGVGSESRYGDNHHFVYILGFGFANRHIEFVAKLARETAKLHAFFLERVHPG